MARVELLPHTGQSCVGTAEGDCEEEANVWAAGQACCNALLKAVGSGEDKIEITGVEVREMLRRKAVFVSVFAYYFRQRRELLGCCVIDNDDIARAATLA